MVEQMQRLFNASFKVQDKRDPRGGPLNARFFVVEADQLPSDGETTWRGRIRLSPTFFDEIMRGAVPLDTDALRALRGSPLRLDIYTWLVHRLDPDRLKKPSPPIGWELLACQFGGDYTRVRAFKAQFVRQLAVVQREAYPGAKVDVTDKGLVLRPSKRAVRAKKR
jgi:hypothetical protein